MSLFSRLFREEPERDPLEEQAYSRRAMEVVIREVGILNGVLGDIPATRTAEVRAKIATKREWADSLEDPRWRKAFHRWLDHAAHCCDKADAYREERPERAARLREMEEEWREVSARAASLGQPR